MKCNIAYTQQNTKYSKIKVYATKTIAKLYKGRKNIELIFNFYFPLFKLNIKKYIFFEGNVFCYFGDSWALFVLRISCYIQGTVENPSIFKI